VVLEVVLDVDEVVATVLVVEVVAAAVVVVIGPVDDVVDVVATVDVVVAPGFFSDGTQSSIRRMSSSCWLPN
jgi:hypothetical protein